jgi:hypothetical protein
LYAVWVATTAARRLQAAHAILAVTAFFEAFDEFRESNRERH